LKRAIPLLVVAALVAVLATAFSATAATPIYKGSVGPGFTIALRNPPTKAGKIRLVVADLSSSHNFHLTGPGVNVATSVGGTGTKTFTITLEKGTYRYRCDPHQSFMKGSFRIS
jgi:hypothetical protein